jgi:tetratricopeptide (TPR) repeat protein
LTREIKYIVLAVVVALPVAADISPENCFEYLESGEANYNVVVSTGNIDWGTSASEIETRISDVEANLESNPNDLDKVLELIKLYDEIDADDESVGLAAEYVGVFRARYDETPTEESATEYAEVVTAARDEGEYDAAYLALQPFLESGAAAKGTFEAAIDLRTAAMDYELAVRIADAYIAVHPDEPNAYYEKFSVASAGNIYGIISYFLGKSVEIFLSERGETTITEDNVKPFIEKYVAALSDAIDIPSIEKAVELDPDDYEYNLAAGIFKTLIVYYSAISSLAVAEDLEQSDVLDIFRSTNPEGIADISPYLERAEAARPENDVQVYLAYALYYMSFGEIDRAYGFAEKAAAIRPDLPESYDALIVLTALPVAAEIADDPSKLAEIFPELLNKKIANTGGTAGDFAVLAAIEFFLYPDTPVKEREARLAKMKEYLDNALSRDTQNPTAIVNLGNYYVLTGDYKEAVKVFGEAYGSAQPDVKVWFLNNRGVAKALEGDEAGAVADFTEALELSKDNERTLNALSAMGVE